MCLIRAVGADWTLGHLIPQQEVNAKIQQKNSGWVYLQTLVIITKRYLMVIVTTTTRRFTRMKIQFPVKASIHARNYRSIYIRIPKAAWIAYQLEQLVDKLVQVSIWKPGEEKPI